MSYSEFILGKTDHISGQKFHTCSGSFVRPLPPRDLQDYILETTKREWCEQEQNRQEMETSEMVALMQRSEDSHYDSIHPFAKLPSRLTLSKITSNSLEDDSHNEFQNSGGIKTPQYCLPSFFQLTGLLYRFEAKMDPLVYSRMRNFTNFFTPESFFFDTYIPLQIRKYLHFIPGTRFHDMVIPNREFVNDGFFLC